MSFKSDTAMPSGPETFDPTKATAPVSSEGVEAAVSFSSDQIHSLATAKWPAVEADAITRFDKGGVTWPQAVDRAINSARIKAGGWRDMHGLAVANAIAQVIKNMAGRERRFSSAA